MMRGAVLFLLLATGALANPLQDLQGPLTAMMTGLTTKLTEIKTGLEEIKSRVAMNENNLDDQRADGELRNEQMDSRIDGLEQSLSQQSEELLATLDEKMKQLLTVITAQLKPIISDIAENGKKIEALGGGYVEPSGPDGPDVGTLREELQAEIDKKIRQVSRMINGLRGQIGKISSNKGRSSGEKSGFNCDVESDGKCFMVVLAQLTVDQARFKCKQLGSELANIYSKSQYDQIMDKARSMVTYHTQMYTGMSYNLATRKPEMRDGSAAPYIRWHQWFPSSTGIWIGFAVDPKNPSSEHMTNFTPPHTANGCICEAAPK